MNDKIKTLILGFVSGLAGAFLYINYYFSDQSNLTKVKNNEQNVSFADYSPSFFRSSDDFVKAASVSTPCVVYIKTVANQQESYTFFDFFLMAGKTVLTEYWVRVRGLFSPKMATL